MRIHIVLGDLSKSEKAPREGLNWDVGLRNFEVLYGPVAVGKNESERAAVLPLAKGSNLGHARMGSLLYSLNYGEREKSSGVINEGLKFLFFSSADFPGPQCGTSCRKKGLNKSAFRKSSSSPDCHSRFRRPDRWRSWSL